jgi:threonine/homoserine/homoserine lactone efflux protein
MTALAVGFGLGLFVGSQPGPVSLLCVRSVLRGAFATGVAIGAGAALIDLLYAGLGLAGAASLLEIDGLRLALGALGALVLAAIGARTLWAAFRVRLGGHRLQPAHDRDLGGYLRRRVDRLAGRG